MAHASHSGRPRKGPTSPLGALVAEQMDAKGISIQGFAVRLRVSRATVWRFLNGRAGFSRRITVETLCQALMLVEEEQAAFMRASARYIEHAEIAHGAVQSVGTSGREAYEAYAGCAGSKASDDDSQSLGRAHVHAEVSPALRFGQFVRDRMDTKGLSQSVLAHTLKVAPSTISRLTRGKLATTHAVDADTMCRALDLNEMDRRTFFVLAAQACLLPIVYRASPIQLRFQSFEQSLGLSLASIEQEMVTLRERRNNGEVAAVYQRAEELFELLFNRPLPVTQITRTPEIARAKLMVGFEFCEAQAAHLDWYLRIPKMIQTLDRMESDVVLRFPSRVFAAEHGHLLNLRGPLFYKRLNQKGLSDSYQESIGELSYALESQRSWYDEPTLHVELLRNRAHAYLLQGDERKWRADLDVARNVARGMHNEERETFQALVEYSWGEGFTRLAYRRDIPLQMRRSYLQTALNMLSESEAVFHRHHRWQGYALLAQIAGAQCLILQDVDEALRRSECSRAAAQQFYPSLLAKIARTTSAAAAVRQKQRGIRQ